jgi:hypothetical protein
MGTEEKGKGSSLLPAYAGGTQGQKRLANLRQAKREAGHGVSGLALSRGDIEQGSAEAAPMFTYPLPCPSLKRGEQVEKNQSHHIFTTFSPHSHHNRANRSKMSP